MILYAVCGYYNYSNDIGGIVLHFFKLFKSLILFCLSVTYNIIMSVITNHSYNVSVLYSIPAPIFIRIPELFINFLLVYVFVV